MSIEHITQIFTQARYHVAQIQPTPRGFRVYCHQMRAPMAIDRHKHFEGTGLTVLAWGTDCVLGLAYVDVAPQAK